MIMIITGHQRSGTTLLQRVLNSHPDIIVTHEFGNFFGLYQPISEYKGQVLQYWWSARNRSFFPPSMQWLSRDDGVERDNQFFSPYAIWASKCLRANMFQNLGFVTRYLLAIGSNQQQHVESQLIENALKNVFSGVKVVGDKHPDYIFHLNKLVKDDKLSILVIYRDPRDVVSSTLEAYLRWKKWWSPEAGIPEKIAERWVKGIELIELWTDNIHVICYEDLVSNPQPTLKTLGDWLGVDPMGFSHKMIRSDSVGKHRQSLSKDQIDDVIRVAGPTMKRIGYKL